MNYLTTELGTTPIIVEGVFPVTPAEAFKAWTNPEEITQWLGENPNTMISAEIDPQIGGNWSFLFIDEPEKTGTLEGKYLEIVENEKLVFNWLFRERFSDGREEVTEQSIVTILFEAASDGTKITLTHENINNHDGLLSVGTGWEGTFNNFANIIANN